jgi:fibronectin type 3 domain-containing protein
MRIIIFVLVLSIFQIKLGAQDVRHSIKAISHPLPDSIQLRWAPSDYETWQASIKYGYIIERFTLVKNNTLITSPKGKVLTPEPLKPIPYDKIEAIADKDKYAAIAASAIYSETFKISTGHTPSLMEIKNIATEQENRFSFALFAADQSSTAARALGLWYTDRLVVKGEKYLYRIYLAQSLNLSVDTGYTYTGPDETRGLPKPVNLMVEAGDKSAILTWTKDATSAAYTSYVVERAGEGLNFSAVNHEPLVNTDDKSTDESPYHFFVDTFPSNYQTFAYRIYGISPFGEKGPYSDTISVSGREQMKSAPVVTANRVENLVVLKWKLEEEIKKELEGYRIIRSEQDDIGYTEIGQVDKDTLRFIDANPLPGNYYKIVAFTKHGAQKASLPVFVQMPDSIPPSPPIGLSTLADTTGKLVLKWKANKETDIYGYRVYRANASNEEFSQLTVTPVRDTFFVDHINLQTLSKNIYYQVLAVDQRQNYSVFSTPLKVTRPDIVPPVAPVITGFESTDKGIKIKWANSTSSDVVTHILYRKDAEKEWYPLKIFKDTITEYLDSAIECGKNYSYTLAAVDSSGLTSLFAKPVTVVNNIFRKNTALILEANADRSKQIIRLTWNKIPNAKKYFIYRSIGEEPLSLYKVVLLKNEFIDDHLQPGTLYTYALSAELDSGKKIHLSRLVKINY